MLYYNPPNMAKTTSNIPENISALTILKSCNKIFPTKNSITSGKNGLNSPAMNSFI